MKQNFFFFTGQKSCGCDMLIRLCSEVFALNRHKPGERSFMVLLQVLWTLWHWHERGGMHHAFLGMPADNLKPIDDLVHGEKVSSPNPPKE